MRLNRGLALSIIAAAMLSPAASADDAATQAELLNADARASIQRGLDYLASRQQANGAFGPSGGHAGITALAGLAFMSAGSLPDRGKHAENVRRCMNYVLSCADQDGLIATDSSQGPMYSHGFAALFLAELYGMAPERSLQSRLQRSVKLLEQSQSREGGWRYQPVPFDADISVTVCQVMALRSARDGGIKVPRQVIDSAVDYVRRCQNRDGGFAYMPRGTDSSFARSAAGVATLYYAGEFESEELRRGLRYLRNASSARASADERHYYYGHYYACQAMLLAGGDAWDEYFPAVRDQLLSRRDARSGAWSGEAGTDYATAMALIILQMPNRYLPILHGKGPGN